MGKGRSEQGGADAVEEVTLRLAKTAADKNQEIIHLELCPRSAGRNHPAGRRFCRKLAVPARIAKWSRQTKGGSQDAAASRKLARKTITSFPSDANGSGLSPAR